MRRGTHLFLGVLLLTILPALSLAQTLNGNGVGADSFGNRPWTDETFSSLSERLLLGLFSPSTLYVGWLEHPKAMTLGYHYGGRYSGSIQWPVKGPWAGYETDLQLRDDFSLLISGGTLLSQRSGGTLLWSDGIADPFDAASYEAWHRQGLFSLRTGGRAQILAGFRWDHASMRLDYWDHVKDDYILNAWIPLVGLQVQHDFSGGRLTVRCIGFPMVRGSLKYHSWDSLGYSEFGEYDFREGHFLEVFAEYSTSIMRNFSLGAFVSWNALHALSREKPLSGSDTTPIYWSIDKRAWVVGGNLVLNFTTPL